MYILSFFFNHLCTCKYRNIRTIRTNAWNVQKSWNRVVAPSNGNDNVFSLKELLVMT